MSLHVQLGFWQWRMEWCDRHLCHVTGSDYAYLNTRIRGWSALDYSSLRLNSRKVK